jgi:hypothetical protein
MYSNMPHGMSRLVVGSSPRHVSSTTLTLRRIHAAKTTKPSEAMNNLYGYSDMEWAVQLDPAYAAARAEVRRLRWASMARCR